MLNSFFHAVFFFINTNSSIIKLTNYEIILISFTRTTFQIFRLRSFDKNKGFFLSTYTRSSLVSKAFRFSTQKLAKSEGLGNKARQRNQWYTICIFFRLRRIVNFVMWFNHCLFFHIIGSITPFLSNAFNPIHFNQY